MDVGEKWIKRKYFLKSVSNLDGALKESWDRYYIFRKNGINLRIQHVNDRYELERMSPESDLSRNKFTIPISKEEFELLKTLAKDEVLRESFQLAGNPTIWLMSYHGRFEGLGRIEVQFESEKEAANFMPFEWFGKEIGGTPLEKEDTMLDLTEQQFQALIKELLI